MEVLTSIRTIPSSPDLGFQGAVQRFVPVRCIGTVSPSIFAKTELISSSEKINVRTCVECSTLSTG